MTLRLASMAALALQARRRERNNIPGSGAIGGTDEKWKGGREGGGGRVEERECRAEGVWNEGRKMKNKG